MNLANRYYNDQQHRLGGAYADYGGRSLKRNEQAWEPLPKYDLNIRLEVIYMENKAIFCSPPKISVPYHMKDNNEYCEFHQDYNHYIANYMNLHAQVMLLIKKGGLQQYLKLYISQPSSSNQDVSSMMEKGNALSNIGEKNLRMVPMTIGKLENTISE